ncbi:hypothetical protein IYQ92_09590 [Streptococcus sp. HF-1907]|uniref:hypothetical protein n=1 Tax=Streptococcus sp. HF-1907 TaxID=2785793 RepID=UPI0018A03417|nr:hypothetical protein [Streptococcus sp. HF-1907]MBF7095446.1 hypothetical protein [Streptococcus sp. HF-1907]
MFSLVPEISTSTRGTSFLGAAKVAREAEAVTFLATIELVKAATWAVEEFDAIESVVTDWVSVEAEDDSATVSAFVATVTSDSATVFF